MVFVCLVGVGSRTTKVVEDQQATEQAGEGQGKHEHRVDELSVVPWLECGGVHGLGNDAELDHDHLLQHDEQRGVIGDRQLVVRRTVGCVVGMEPRNRENINKSDQDAEHRLHDGADTEEDGEASEKQLPPTLDDFPEQTKRET